MKDPLTYTDDQLGLIVRPVFIDNWPIEFPDSDETEYHDLYVWFAAASEYPDSWFAFALSDTDDMPGEMVANSDSPERLRRMAVWIGVTWNEIESDCPHCIGEGQRERYHSMPEYLVADLDSTSIDKLNELRVMGEWKAQADSYELATGQKLSLN